MSSRPVQNVSEIATTSFLCHIHRRVEFDGYSVPISLILNLALATVSLLY